VSREEVGVLLYTTCTMSRSILLEHTHEHAKGVRFKLSGDVVIYPPLSSGRIVVTNH
jgi:hypothetical protein